jgi:UDP-N-acetylglucosamine transferase subunit ALG13
MILVSTGTNGSAFDRLLHAVAGLGLEHDMVVQHGPSKVRPRGARCLPYVSFVEYSELVRQADTIVTHAGAGSVLVSLMNGKRPYVVPRLAHFREAVDDHQVVFGRRLASAGLVSLVDEPVDLVELLRAAPSSDALGVSLKVRSPLVDDLAEYLQGLAGTAKV